MLLVSVIWKKVVILFVASFAAATISGVAGFGGALLLLPVLMGSVGAKAAVPILTIGQLFGNASRVWFGRYALSWKPIAFFLLTAIPLSILGSRVFISIDSSRIKAGIGLFLILLVVYRRLKIRKINLGSSTMLVGGALTGFLSGLLGSAGPLGAAFFLSLNLEAAAYIASEAFTALVMHLVKTFIYNKYSLIGLIELYYGLFVGMAMVLGSWTGKKIVETLSREKFVLLVESLLIVSGMQLIWTAV